MMEWQTRQNVVDVDKPRGVADSAHVINLHVVRGNTSSFFISIDHPGQSIASYTSSKFCYIIYILKLSIAHLAQSHPND